VFHSSFRSHGRLRDEIVALRHQVVVLGRSQRGPLRVSALDRFLWVWLSRLWSDGRSVLVIAKPETVISWHHQGSCLYSSWRSRGGQAGRPKAARQVRELIRKTSLANQLWGAPRIHGGLLSLGINVSQATVPEYTVRQ